MRGVRQVSLAQVHSALVMGVSFPIGLAAHALVSAPIVQLSPWVAWPGAAALAFFAGGLMMAGARLAGALGMLVGVVGVMAVLTWTGAPIGGRGAVGSLVLLAPLPGVGTYNLVRAVPRLLLRQ